MRSIIFDLDGTLIDTVYAHVLAWQRALGEAGIAVPGWTIHRMIGLGGAELAMTIARGLGKELSSEEARGIDKHHSEVLNQELLPDAPTLPGAVELLAHLHQMKVSYGIATSGKRGDIEKSLNRLGITEDIAVVCASEIERAKPEPDLLLACQERLNTSPGRCFVVGDSIWDLLAARRAGMLGLGVLTGGITEELFTGAGAYRVYRDTLELDARLYELGLMSSTDPGACQ
jgi:HAD superfamily hydrolase (TIGR01549 family)